MKYNPTVMEKLKSSSDKWIFMAFGGKWNTNQVWRC